MKKILILMGRYLPGYKDGGPVRTIKNLTDILGDEFEFYIICNDRDHGDSKPYPNIVIDKHYTIGKSKVLYVKEGAFKFKTILKEVKNKDLVYCCGPYGIYTIKLLILRKLHLVNSKIVIASMGSFSNGALSLKSKKKNFFILCMKLLGLYKKVIWSVTSTVEENDLKEILGNNSNCYIAEDLPRIENIQHINKKNDNTLKIIFLSRITMIKNLEYAIEILSKITDVKIQFDIYGFIEDLEYWNLCKNRLFNLPKNIAWNYKGECDSNEVVEIFSLYDIFLFPTLGENYGHVIGEALLAGCIPLISDKTPWKDLDILNCGRVVDVTNKSGFINAIYDFAYMSPDEFQILINNAYEYIVKKNNESINNTGYRRIFNL